LLGSLIQSTLQKNVGNCYFVTPTPALDTLFPLRFPTGNKIPIIQLFSLFLHEVSVFMSGKKTTLLPGPEKILKELGVNLKLARKRRKLTRNLVAERAGIARSTLQLIEDGNPGVAMSSYLQVLFVLGLEKDLLRVAADDLLGRKLQDAALLNKKKGNDKAN
jgi:DNA-binding XRE family transcriptional regulator